MNIIANICITETPYVNGKLNIKGFTFKMSAYTARLQTVKKYNKLHISKETGMYRYRCTGVNGYMYTQNYETKIIVSNTT